MFNSLLKDEGSGDSSKPTAPVSLISDRLRDVANLLFQFIFALEADVSLHILYSCKCV